MAALLYLVEAQPRQASDGAARTVRLAGGGAAYPYFYAGEHWMAGITGAPTIITSLSFDGTDLGTGGVPQAAEIVWGTANRADLADLAGLVWADAPITIRIGPEGSLPPIALSGKVLTATVEDGGKLKIAMADPAADLKKPLLTDRFGGTGGLDGPADWAGTIKRRIWGRVFNVLGEPLDPVHNIYAFADPLRHLQAITGVRDKGAAGPLTVLAWAGTAEATFAALQAAAVPAGGGIVCPSLACVRWWTQPAGDLTADIEGETEGGYVETAAGIASRLVAAVAGPAFAAGAIASADADRPAPVGWIASDESTTVAAMLDQLLGSVSILWALNAAGQIELRRWEWGASSLSVQSHAVTRSASYRPVSSRRLGYRRNEHKMARGSLAAVVLVNDVAFDDGSGLADTLTDIATVASNAASAAATAQAAANLANAGLADIAADNVLTPGEKPQVVLNYNVLVTEHAGIDGQASAYGITTERTNYDNALDALLSYLSGLTSPYLWSNLTGSTDISGPTFRAKFADVYAARQILLNAISAKAKLLADNAAADAAEASDAAAIAATTATWTGISGGGGAPTGSDVASTVAPGGGVANNQVTTPAITADAVSGAYFAQSANGTITGNSSVQVPLSFNVPMDFEGDIIIFCQVQLSAASGVSGYTGIRAYSGFNSTVSNPLVFGGVAGLVTLIGRLQIAAGTDWRPGYNYTFNLEFQVTSGSSGILPNGAKFIIFKRYR